jgi:hypothetical protein
MARCSPLLPFLPFLSFLSLLSLLPLLPLLSLLSLLLTQSMPPLTSFWYDGIYLLTSSSWPRAS